MDFGIAAATSFKNILSVVTTIKYQHSHGKFCIRFYFSPQANSINLACVHLNMGFKKLHFSCFA